MTLKCLVLSKRGIISVSKRSKRSVLKMNSKASEGLAMALTTDMRSCSVEGLLELEH